MCKKRNDLSVFIPKNVPGGFIVFLSLVVIFETVIFFTPYGAWNFGSHKATLWDGHPVWDPKIPRAWHFLDYEVWKHFDKVSLTPQAFDILVLGHCFTRSAVKPLVLDKELDLNTFSFSLAGRVRWITNYFLLKRYLKHSITPPKLLLLSLEDPAVFSSKGVAMNAVKVKKHLAPWFKFSMDFLEEFPWDQRGQIILDYFVANNIPSLKNQYFLRKSNWVSKILNFDHVLYNSLVTHYIETNKGYYHMPLPPHKYGKWSKPMKVKKEQLKKGRSLYYNNLFYFEKTIKLAEDNNLNVAILTQSRREDIHTYFLSKRIPDYILKYANTLPGKFSNIVGIIDMRDSVVEFEHYVDWIHLTPRGADVFTKALVQHLKRIDTLKEFALLHPGIGGRIK